MTRYAEMTPTPRLCDDQPVVPPPPTVTVEYDPKPVLHLPNGKVLVRRIGF